MAEKVNSIEISNKLNYLEKELDGLILDYEQFFLGFQRVEPISKRRTIERLFRELDNTYIANATLKFKLQTLRQRFVTYREKWNRILRQIEEGTYIREIKRAQRRGFIDETEAKKLAARDARFKRKLIEEEAQKSPAREAGKAKDREKSLPQREKPQSSGTDYEQLYRKYVNINGGKAKIPFNKWKSRLEQERLKLISKTKAKDIEFKVVEVNGKPKIKAVPKK